MRRVVIPELLDTDSGTPAEIATALSDLRNINQWFGGVDTTQLMISEVAQKAWRHFSFLVRSGRRGRIRASLRQRPIA